jgi:hypothetical protein
MWQFIFCLLCRISSLERNVDIQFGMTIPLILVIGIWGGEDGHMPSEFRIRAFFRALLNTHTTCFCPWLSGNWCLPPTALTCLMPIVLVPLQKPETNEWLARCCSLMISYKFEEWTAIVCWDLRHSWHFKKMIITWSVELLCPMCLWC